jgi:hypothetical protein
MIKKLSRWFLGELNQGLEVCRSLVKTFSHTHIKTSGETIMKFALHKRQSVESTFILNKSQNLAHSKFGIWIMNGPNCLVPKVKQNNVTIEFCSTSIIINGGGLNEKQRQPIMLYN